MPFKSEQQRRFLWAKHPEIAKKWSHGEHSSKGSDHKMPSKDNSNLKSAAIRRLRQSQPTGSAQEGVNQQRGIGTVPVVAGNRPTANRRGRRNVPPAFNQGGGQNRVAPANLRSTQPVGGEKSTPVMPKQGSPQRRNYPVVGKPAIRRNYLG